MADLLRAMDNTFIDKACLIPFPESRGKYFFWTKKDMEETAIATIKAVEAHPDRFYSLIWLNPALPVEENIDILEKYVLGGPINGVKLHIQVKASDRRMDPLAEFMDHHRIPLLFHAWYKTVQRYVYESSPADIADLAGRFPHIPILMAHLTGSGKRGVQDIKYHENISIDTSGSQPEDGFLQYALEEMGEDRVVFGSDYPGREMATQLARVYSLDLKGGVRDKVLYKNAMAFFEKGGVK